MERTRDVEVVPQHGGMPCGGNTETVSCNLQACDRDCSLGDWGPWSPCSKMCDGGLSERRKDVTEEPLGSGKCEDRNSDVRLEYKPCNEHSCRLSPGKTTLRCLSRLDVTLLLDGSGSLKPEDWEATKTAAKMLVKAFNGGEKDGVMLSVLLFSGPRSWEKFVLCTQGPEPGQAPPDLAKDCSITWVERGGSDMQAVEEKLDKMKWPRGTTLMSSALSTAMADLRNGRRDAESVVVVVTDGRPMSPLKTLRASIRIRQQARLMFVPVTQTAPLAEIRHWATKPLKENVIQVPSYEALKEPATINELIANMCPRVQ